MENGVLTDERLGELGRVADIALDDLQIGRIGQPATEIKLVIDRDMVPF
jgi:hypothetical protein